MDDCLGARVDGEGRRFWFMERYVVWGSFIRGKRGIDRWVCISAGGERGSYLKCTAVQLPGRAWVAGRVEGGVCRKRFQIVRTGSTMIDDK